MNARRFLAAALILSALFLLPAIAQSATTASSTMTVTIPTSLSLTLVTGATLTFGTVTPPNCVVLNGTAAAPTSSVDLSVTSNAPWHLTIASSTATGGLLNGTVLTTNALQWAASALTGSGFGPFANISGTAATVTSNGIVTANHTFLAYQWCASAADQGGAYSMTANYVVTSP
jgi:hypothetical protein